MIAKVIRKTPKTEFNVGFALEYVLFMVTPWAIEKFESIFLLGLDTTNLYQAIAHTRFH
jgi:hypothetical protein